MAKNKVALVSLGCPKNLVNSEQMLYLLADAGFELVGEPEEADCVVVNTCGFIESAKSEAIDTILALAELKKTGKLKSIVATGCLVQRYQDEFMKELPEVDCALGTGSYGDIVEAVKSSLKGKGLCRCGDIDLPDPELGRIVSTGPGWAYLRIAEGCSNRCAYCVIPSIRGRYRSRKLEDVVEEAEALAKTGVKELIVVAQDVTRYGTDLYGKHALPELLHKLCKIKGIEWIRLHYLYPDEFDDELIDTIASEKKIVKYIDVPLQHIDDTILKRMNRRGTGAEIRALLKKLRERIPGVVIRTSLIVGLPGEGEAEFAELCDFLKEAKMERAGVFVFSPEEGTPAAAMDDRCTTEEAEKRQELVMEIQNDIMDEWSRGFVGKDVRVLCEGYDEETGMQFGRTYADSPEIDGIVFFSGECPAGQIGLVHIDEFTDGEWYGSAVEG